MTCLFPLNSGNLSFRDSVGRAKPNGVQEGANERREEREWMKTPTAMPNAIVGCVSGLFLFGGPNIYSVLSRAPLVHIWTLVLEKHVLVIVNCFIDSLLDRLKQSYCKKVVEQWVVIPTITWLTSKFLVQLQIGHSISNVTRRNP